MSGNTPGKLPDTGGYAGIANFQALTNQFAALDGLVRQVIAGKAFAGLVKVVAVTGGGPGGPATVDVQPLVNQVDGIGNPTPHGIVPGLPCFRFSAGVAAFIVDPVVGDIGQAIICDRDISSVKETRAQANPGSFRTNSWSDGCYFGSFLSGAASTYVMIGSDSVAIVTGGTVAVTSAMLTHNGVNVGSTHTHSGVQSGGSDTGPPT